MCILQWCIAFYRRNVLYHGTSKVWTSFFSGDLEIAHLVERFSCLARCGTFCTLNNKETWRAVSGEWRRAARGRERDWEFSLPGCWRSGFTQDQDSFKLGPVQHCKALISERRQWAMVCILQRWRKPLTLTLHGRRLNYPCPEQLQIISFVWSGWMPAPSSELLNLMYGKCLGHHF